MVHKEFRDMSKKEKRDFLSNDFIERIIRVEQRICAHFKKPVLYNETEYYKSLTSQEQKAFETYRKMKKVKKIAFVAILTFSLFSLALLNLDFTGNTIKESVSNPLPITLIIFTVILVSVISFLIVYRKNNILNNRYNEYVQIIDDALSKKHSKEGKNLCVVKKSHILHAKYHEGIKAIGRRLARKH